MRHVAAALAMAIAALALVFALAQSLEYAREGGAGGGLPGYDERRADDARSGHPGR